MNIAVSQIECIPGDTGTNCARIISSAEEAKRRGCDVVVLPELSDTGYDLLRMRELASPWDGTPMKLLCHAAADLNMHIICGISEKEGERIYNSIAVAGPDGAITASYRKAHLFSSGMIDERNHFVPGSRLETVRVGTFMLGLLICYDLRFPEMTRTLALKGVNALVVCADWPARRSTHWEVLCRARAIENQCYVMAANRCGTDNGLEFAGKSVIIDPAGTVLCEAPAQGETLITAVLDLDLVAGTRAAIGVLRDRRRDLYST